MAEMSDREMLSAILKAVEMLGAEVKTLGDRTLHIENDMNDFRKDMNEFRRETTNNFNKVDRRLRFIETDYQQLNERVDKLELGDTNH